MIQQKSSRRQTVVLNRVYQDFIDRVLAKKEPPVYMLTPDEARRSLLRIQSHPASKIDAQVKDLSVNSGRFTLRLRLIRPNHATNPGVIIYFHGAGWVMGDATTHDRLIRELAVGANATVVFLDYERAPEHPYPIAIEESYEAIRYVVHHAEDLGVDVTKLAVAGDSAGGNIATVVALLSGQRSGPAISGQLLFYPVTNADFESHSYKQFAEGPWLTRRAMQWFWHQYLPDHEKRREPHASPLLTSLQELSRLPRTLIRTAENDVLRNEGEAYGRKLIQAGVEVVTTRYTGTIHDFVMLNDVSQAAPTRAAIGQATRFLRSVFTSK